MNPIVYLAGPVCGMSWIDATSWRTYAAMQFRKYGVDTLSPLRNMPVPANPNEYILGDTKAETPLSTAPYVGLRSYIDVRRSDAIFVDHNTERPVSQGTMLEIGAAYALNKPVVLWTAKCPEHPVLYTAAPLWNLDLDRAINITLSLLGRLDGEVK